MQRGAERHYPRRAMLSADSVVGLASSPAVADAARGLATPTRWRDAGRSDRAVWGSCWGRAPEPYQVAVDLAGPAFRCTCPARRSPCRHGLGLLLLAAADPDALPTAEPPEPVTRWLAGRDRPGRAPRTAPADPAAQAARAEARATRIDAGVAELERWLADLVRQGLAAARAQPYRFWDAMAARLVDAQAPGLAGRVRRLAGVAASGEGWQERLLADLGLLHLAVRGWQRRDTLDEASRADLRAVVGWPVPAEEVLAGPTVRDRWVVLGRRRIVDERLSVQRVWLRGRSTGRDALSLTFVGPGQEFDASLVVGTVVDSDLAFYPGRRPLRALVAARHGAAEAVTGSAEAVTGSAETATRSAKTASGLPGVDRVAAAPEALAAALAEDPWTERVPVVLTAVVPQPTDAGWGLRDAAGALLPLAGGRGDHWSLVAVAAGRPVTVAGEYADGRLAPLTVAAGEDLVPL